MTYVERIALRIQTKGDGIGEEISLDLALMYALLVLAKGKRTALENVHDAWACWKFFSHPLHHSLVPFDELAPRVQEKDRPFVEIIWEVSAEVESCHMPTRIEEELFSVSG